MKPNSLALGLARALAVSTLLAVPAVHAQQAGGPAAGATELDAVQVTGQIVYRDRSAATAPTLSYGVEYFQKFEPRTVGDMLKRVPSVAFVSDVLEYDGARLRGLGAGYTQILINGRKVPGGGDRSFFVDRIPAEVVERVEIVRSASANRSGDAVAGAINIVLRDAYEFDGGYVRLGASRFDDGEVTPTLAAVASGAVGDGRVLAGVSHQGRYNPKQKTSLRYAEPDGAFDNREDQSDIRDGDDTSFNLSYVHDVGDAGRLSLSGLYVRTDRTETEHSREYNVPVGFATDNLLSVNDQVEEIRQDNFAVKGDYRFDMAGGETAFGLSFARFDDDTVSTEEEVGYDDGEAPPAWDGFEGTREMTALRDDESGASLSHRRPAGAAEFEFGIDALRKERRFDQRTSEVEAEEEGAPLPPYAGFDTTLTDIREDRLDPYVMLSGSAGRFDWETGLRLETTDIRIDADGEAFEQDQSQLLPSAHLRWNLTAQDRLGLSLARTVRRQSFDYLTPVLLDGEYGDNDFIGNPMLEQESAVGLDLGFEHRLGKRGVVGLNLFYRDVSDLIELVSTGEPSETALEDFEDDVADFLDENPGAGPGTPGYPVFDPDSFVYTAANVGDGEVFGVEFDLSTPLDALGLPDTGVFLNYSWLDSNIEDAMGERRFNDQARSVFNVGFIQDLPTLGMSFGLSYRDQGDAYARLLAEEVTTSYGEDLEAFVEKRFGESWSVRLTGTNLLDASKDEVFHKFDTLGDQIDRDYDEYEIESEVSGPVYQMVVRYAF